MTIPHGETRFFKRTHLDPTGRTFMWNERVFRGIYPDSVEHVRRLFASGFVEELASEKRAPKTWITDYQAEGFAMILEHERIWPAIYPEEWTSSMLRDAAIFVCRVAQKAKSRGYNMRDCHGKNVLFDGVTPKYVDLGSFIPDTSEGWLPADEFASSYLYPLYMWTIDPYVARLSPLSRSRFPRGTYLRHRYSAPGRLSRRVLDRFLGDRRGRSRLSGMDLEGTVKEMERYRLRSVGSPAPRDRNGTDVDPAGLGKILTVVEALPGSVSSALVLGGREGIFASALARDSRLDRVASVDPDHDAVDKGYRAQKTAGRGKLSFANLDFMRPTVRMDLPMPPERFKADVVFALALAHDLVLSQAFDIADVLQTFARYATQFVFTEFLPPRPAKSSQKPDVPGWYNLGWFRQAFAEALEPMSEVELSEGRILFVGRVRGC